MKYLSFLVLISLITAATVASASTITIGFDPPSIPMVVGFCQAIRKLVFYFLHQKALRIMTAVSRAYLRIMVQLIYALLQVFIP
jgi:hypothetical protein